MTLTTPRTWVTGEVVTAAMMNSHVRDNENAILAAYAGRSVAAAREGAPIVDGANHTCTSSQVNNSEGTGIDWAALTAQGTVQWRSLMGFNVAALNTATVIVARPSVWCPIRASGLANVFTVFWAPQAPGNFTLTTGYKWLDSGWITGAPTGDAQGFYFPSYRFDWTTGTGPSINDLSMAVLVQIV